MQVPLGVISKNQNKTDEMYLCTVFDQTHDFVLQTAKQALFNHEVAVLEAEAFHHYQFLIGGFHMTAAHCCGSVAAHCDH